MSRTTLCILTAGALIALSLGVAVVRCVVLGEEARVPVGVNTWKVTMVVQGHSLGDAKLQTATPLDIDRQHVLRETWRSSTFLDKPPSARHPQRRLVHWTQRAGTGEGPFRARYEFFCTVGVHRATPSMSQLHAQLYAPPEPGKHLDPTSYAAGDNERISELARRLTDGIERQADQAEALYRYVAMDVANEPSTGGPGTKAVECLDNGSGDAGGKSRLLTALLRNRGIPARMVTGLTLTRGPEQLVHRWVEAWVEERWFPLCPFYRHFGHVPPTYLIIGFGDLSVARARNVRDLTYAFLVERTLPDEAVPLTEVSTTSATLRRAFRAVSLFVLPPHQQRYVEFLLLLPVAALIVCLFRNVIGLDSFGTFAPALVGLAFRDLHALPGLLIFASILLVGWLVRRVLDHYHLLQVPRVAVMLSIVVGLLVATLVVANIQNLPATEFIPFFPMVILTGMIERFWTLETEDSTATSLKTLACTLGIATSIALLLNVP
ncbi:MAG TPA: 7TM domain-containing protein, partial [Gemmataceae bacterium]|nr:7TM domain-containing protein [Gemmataceae bacterium]